MRWPVLFLVGLCACGNYVPPDTIIGPRWDLSKPLYVSMSPTMPKRDMVEKAMRDALYRAGGVMSPDPATPQRMYLADTDGGDCERNGVAGFTELPARGTFYICHTKTLLSSYTQDDLFWIVAHELGHEFANRRDHIGGDVDPPACNGRNIMASNLACKPATSDYTGPDLAYICEGRNVIGGRCARQAALP